MDTQELLKRIKAVVLPHFATMARDVPRLIRRDVATEESVVLPQAQKAVLLGADEADLASMLVPDGVANLVYLTHDGYLLRTVITVTRERDDVSGREVLLEQWDLVRTDDRVLTRLDLGAMWMRLFVSRDSIPDARQRFSMRQELLSAADPVLSALANNIPTAEPLRDLVQA